MKKYFNLPILSFLLLSLLFGSLVFVFQKVDTYSTDTPSSSSNELNVINVANRGQETTQSEKVETSSNTIPGIFRNKIIYRSDRMGQPQLFVMNPDGSNVAVLNDTWVYDLALKQQTQSPNGPYQVIVSQEFDRRPQLVIVSSPENGRQQLTFMTRMAYNPAWSSADKIAFVSPDHNNDEIFVINANGSGIQRLTHNSWEWDKHPSWSPDSSRLVFWSNREGGNQQIWMMNADGSNQHNISNNEFNEWDPVWIR